MTSVLVVDDSSVERRLAGGLLESQGMRVIYAADGREALAAVRSGEPDLVLTDLQMPEVDGLELVQELALVRPGLPVVLMTAHGSEEIAVAALKAGAASYIPKKNLARGLASTVETVLGVARFRSQQRRVLDSLEEAQARFQLANDWDGIQPLVERLQRELREMNFCPESEVVRVGTALSEALHNAVHHGNLQLSDLGEAPLGESLRLADERRVSAPYRDRRVRVTSHLTRDRAAYSVEDEGPGFDPHALPDPTDPANLETVGGRGLLLVRLFMDEVTFNDRGNRITMVKHRPA